MEACGATKCHETQNNILGFQIHNLGIIMKMKAQKWLLKF
jgi:hypothetical protein